MLVIRRRGVELAQVLTASTRLTVQVATSYITQRLVLTVGDHYITPVMFVHQFQRVGHRGLRANRWCVVRRIFGLHQ
ncbi:hypothetical protein D3C80_1881270 [compost metagenome]